MKFLIDVNASGAVARWLRESGHDVVEVADKDVGLPDDKILQWAMLEKRIIVTTDKDFEEMIWCQGKSHHGILRLENLPRVERKRLVEYVLEKHAEDLALGYIVIAQVNRIRVRKPLQISKNW